GAPTWRNDAPHFGSAPTLTDEAVVFAANLRKERGAIVARVRSLSVLDGSQRWARDVRGRSPYVTSVATAADERGVAVVDLDGRVTMLDARRGRLRWRRATDRRQYEAIPVVVGGTFVLPTYGTGLTALGVRRGDVVENDEPGVVQTQVTIEATAAAGDRLYVLVQYGNGDGGVWM